MHDLVRDLALHITSESPRYLVKAGMQLEELPNEQKWKEDVEKSALFLLPHATKKETELSQHCLHQCHVFLSKLYQDTKCQKIEKLFCPELVHNLQHLEEIKVDDCEQLVEIIATSDHDEDNMETRKDSIVFALPKLRITSF
ncbi:hypothetical protein Q3G72_004057 [Acer saccharum]|nr:hypothetical protein Q3G72_004057 [Acer saccharum]